MDPTTNGPLCDYNRSPAEIDRLTGRLIDTAGTATDDRFVCYRLDGTDEFSDIGRQIEREVFEATFTGNDADLMVREYGPYERASLFFLSVDRLQRRPVGALRIVGNSPAGLKTVNDLTSAQLPVRLTREQIQEGHRIDDWDSCWDVATVAVAPDYRRAIANTTLQLYRGMYVSALEHHIDHLIAIIDKAPLLAMTDYLSIPFTPLCQTGYFPYLESAESRAVHGFVPDFHPIITARLSELRDDPVAVRALSYIILGTHDQTLLFDRRPVSTPEDSSR